MPRRTTAYADATARTARWAEPDAVIPLYDSGLVTARAREPV
jgi:hypothetical protein